MKPVTRYLLPEADPVLLDETREALTDLRLIPKRPDRTLLPSSADAAHFLRLDAGWTFAEIREIRSALEAASGQLLNLSTECVQSGTKSTLRLSADRLHHLRHRWC